MSITYVLISCAQAFMATVIFLLSFYGYGRLVIGGELREKVGLTTTFGCCLYLALGGILCALGLAYSEGVYALLAVGVLAAVLSLRTPASRPKPGKWVWLLLGFVVIVSLPQGIELGLDIGGDDRFAYVAFPVQLLDTGSYIGNVLSERRILGGYQSYTFIQASSIALAGLDWITLSRVLGSALTFLLIAEPFSSHRFAKTALFSAVVVALYPVPDFNISGGFIIIPVIIGFLYYMVMHAESQQLGRVILITALYGVTSCSIKSIYIIFAIPLMVFCLIWVSRVKKLNVSQMAYLFSGVAIVSAALLASWIYCYYMSTGSLLWPILGNGYHPSAYEPGFNPMAATTDVREILMAWFVFTRTNFYILLILIVLACLSCSYDKRLKFFLSLSLLAFFIGYIYIVGTDPRGALDRYTFAPIIAYCGWLIMIILAYCKEQKESQFLPVVYVCGGLMLSMSPFYLNIKTIHDYTKPVNRIEMPALKETYRAMQNTLPEGATILVSTEYSYLFDFKRNRIEVVGLLSGGPAPGYPLQSSPAEQMEYLRSLGVDYVILMKEGVPFVEQLVNKGKTTKFTPRTGLIMEGERLRDFYKLNTHPDAAQFLLKSDEHNNLYVTELN